MDTRDKRASAISVGLPWRGLWPAPDGAALNRGDRQQALAFYRVAAPAASLFTLALTGVGR